MRMRLSAVAVLSIALSGCYHVTVMSKAQPSATVVDRPWQHSFLYGLVPPPELNVKEQCPTGVAKVETEHSFVNVVAYLITQGIYSPIHTRVTCAAP